MRATSSRTFVTVTRPAYQPDARRQGSLRLTAREGTPIKRRFPCMRFRRSLIWSCLAIVAACGKSKAQREPAAPPAAAVALPAETKTIIGLDVAPVAASPLAAPALRALLAEDPETRAKLDGLLARCKLDPAADLKTIAVAMAAPEDVAVVATGRLDEKSLVACIRETAAVEQRTRTYAATANDRHNVSFAFARRP